MVDKLKLHRASNGDVFLFFNPNEYWLDDLQTKPKKIEIMQIDPSFTHFGCATEWEVAPVQIALSVDDFTEVFLSDNNIEDVTVKHPRRNTPGSHSGVYFEISRLAIDALSKKLTEKNVSTISDEILQQEAELFEEGGNTNYPTNYCYPISFLSETVQKSLKLQKNIKTNEDDEQHSKSRFRPAHEIYDRIKHDNSIDQDFVIIGYLDRFKGIKETPFNSFVTLDNERHYNTSIPFHRIRHYKYKDTVVWDRDSRINLIDGNAFMNI